MGTDLIASLEATVEEFGQQSQALGLRAAGGRGPGSHAAKTGRRRERRSAPPPPASTRACRGKRPRTGSACWIFSRSTATGCELPPSQLMR